MSIQKLTLKREAFGTNLSQGVAMKLEHGRYNTQDMFEPTNKVAPAMAKQQQKDI